MTSPTLDQIRDLYFRPILPLMMEAMAVHRQHHHPLEIQVNSLISIKTGGCSEDCSYCPQAARYQTAIEKHGTMGVEQVVNFAREAIGSGASRVCLGAAWRNVKDNEDFDRVCSMVKEVSAMGVEVCCTLGMLTEGQAQRLKTAGLTAYNHNLDTSPEYYGNVITTRTYDDRLQTLEHVRNQGLSVCCGGIIGLGETDEDRISLLHTLSGMNPHPESVPINALVAVEGTPLQDQPRVSIWEMVRMIATARILMPDTKIRISAGRKEMPWSEQALCFLSGANSIFSGEKLLTTPNPQYQSDHEMFDLLGLFPKKNVKGNLCKGQ